MGKVRVGQIAKELNIKVTEAIVRLKELGIDAKSNLSTIEEVVANRLRSEFGAARSAAKMAQPAAPKIPKIVTIKRPGAPVPPGVTLPVITRPPAPPAPVPEAPKSAAGAPAPTRSPIPARPGSPVPPPRGPGMVRPGTPGAPFPAGAPRPGGPAVPGRPAPKLIPASAVERMRTGSVIVDLAAETGGNCEVTVPGDVVEHGGVTVIGTRNLPATMAFHASQLYSRNVGALLLHLAPEGELVLDWEDEITRGACVTRSEGAAA